LPSDKGVHIAIRGFLPANSFIIRLVGLVRVIEGIFLVLMVVTAVTVRLFPAAHGGFDRLTLHMTGSLMRGYMRSWTISWPE
jgi:hypothetical protein